jgi:hypothetical protein
VDKQMLKALIELSPASMSQIAREADVNQANLSAWFTQDRKISEDSVLRVEQQLGLDADELSTDRVFTWRTDMDFELLQMVLDRFFDNPKLMPIVKKRVRPYTLEDLYSQPLALVVDDVGHKAVLIMKYTESEKVLILGPKVPWFSPDFLKGTTWLLEGDSDTPDCPGLAKVSTELFQALKKGNGTLENVRQMLNATNTIDWQDVIELAKNKNLGPYDVYELINDHNH